MKLIKGMVTNTIDGENFAIATGKATKTFKGIIKNNSTAAYIFELLKTEQTEDSIVAAMLEKYDAPEDVIRADVREILDLLKEKKLIEE
ncbi:MAG: PqqD family protein [Eubacterium sp.]|nr:PqqD family protein [Eubacterium sp.]